MARSRFVAILVAASAALIAPTSAPAITYCVPTSGAGCDQSQPGVQQALTAAQASAADDVVRIGPGVFANGPFTYIAQATSGKLEITGAGTASTILTSPGTADNETVLAAQGVNGGSPPDIRHLQISVPLGPGYTNGIGFNGTAEDLRVTSPVGGAGSGPIAGFMNPGAVLKDSTIDMPTSGHAQGFQTSGATRIENSSVTRVISARGGSAPGGLVIERSRIASLFACALTARVENSLVVNTGTEGSLFQVVAGAACTNSESTVLDASHITVVGSGTASQNGFFADAYNGTTATLELRNSIIRNVDRSFFIRTTNATATAVLRSSASDWERSKILTSGPGTETLEEPLPNIDADPLFADPLNDFHLLAGSPAIDAGDPAPLATDESPIDLDGNARIQNGRRDMGAFESTPVTAAATVKDLAAPSISGAGATPSKFAVDSAGAAEVEATRKRTKKGTTFKYTLSEAGRMVFKIERAGKGRKSGKRCVKQTKKNKRKKRCTRYSKAGSFATQSVAGKNSKKFSGKIGKKRLRPAKYRATLTATDAAGNKSKPRTLTFRVVRR